MASWTSMRSPLLMMIRWTCRWDGNAVALLARSGAGSPMVSIRKMPRVSSANTARWWSIITRRARAPGRTWTVAAGFERSWTEWMMMNVLNGTGGTRKAAPARLQWILSTARAKWAAPSRVRSSRLRFRRWSASWSRSFNNKRRCITTRLASRFNEWKMFIWSMQSRFSVLTMGCCWIESSWRQLCSTSATSSSERRSTSAWMARLHTSRPTAGQTSRKARLWTT